MGAKGALPDHLSLQIPAVLLVHPGQVLPSVVCLRVNPGVKAGQRRIHRASNIFRFVQFISVKMFFFFSSVFCFSISFFCLKVLEQAERERTQQCANKEPKWEKKDKKK